MRPAVSHAQQNTVRSFRKPGDPGGTAYQAGRSFSFSATTSPLLRFAKGSRIPLTWSLAPGGWDGLSRLHGNAEQSRGAERQSAR